MRDGAHDGRPAGITDRLLNEARFLPGVRAIGRSVLAPADFVRAHDGHFAIAGGHVPRGPGGDHVVHLPDLD